jgi:hypothetical protein
MSFLKRFLEWFWFRHEPNYRRKTLPITIIKIKGGVLMEKILQFIMLIGLFWLLSKAWK